MKNILIEGWVLLPPEEGAGGAGRHFHTLLSQLNKRRDVNITVTTSPRNLHLFSPYKNIETATFVDLSPENYRTLFSWADVFFSPLNGLWPRFIPDRLPVVSCIHDLQHLVAPAFFDKPMWHARNHDYGFAIHRSDRLVAISEFEKNNLFTYFGKRDVDVVHHSGYLADHIEDPAHNELLLKQLEGEDYVLYPAIPWPHKNHTNLLHAWSIFSKKQSGKKVKLLLTGALEHGHIAKGITDEIKRLGLDHDVIVAGFQDDGTQARLIANAKLLLFPTLYEGFGIPVLEAMQLGTPVLASRLPSIVEFGGTTIEYISDPYNPYAIAQDLISALGNWSTLKKRATQAKELALQTYSSENMAQKTLDCLRQAVQQKQKGYTDVFSIGNTSGVIKPSIAGIVRIESSDAGSLSSATGLQSLKTKVSALRRVMDSVFVFASDNLPDEVTSRLLALCVDNQAQMRVFSESMPSGLAAGLEHLFAVSSVPDYIYLTKWDRQEPSASELKTALTELNFFPDLGATLLRSDGGRQFSRIVRPLPQLEAHEHYLKLKSDPITPFDGCIVRTATFKEHGYPGSLRFLAGFVNHISFIECPTGEGYEH